MHLFKYNDTPRKLHLILYEDMSIYNFKEQDTSLQKKIPMKCH